MSHFTEAQATSSKLEEAQKNYVDGSWGYWTFKVSGSDGESHFWVDHNLAENANSATIKGKVIAYLTGSEDFHVEITPPVVSSSFNTTVTGSLG